MQKILYLCLVLVCCNLKVGAQVSFVSNDDFEGVKPLALFKEKVDLRQVNQLPPSYEVHASLSLDKSLLKRFSANPSNRLVLRIPGEKEFTLQLEKVELVSPEARLITPDGLASELVDQEMLFYQGQLKGIDKSSVSLSIIDHRIVGLISHPVLGDLQIAPLGDSPTYIFYRTNDWADKIGVFCDTPDEPTRYLPEQLVNSTNLRSADIPLTLYLEIDYDVFLHYGDVNSTKAFALTLFNQLRGLYSGEHINVLLADLFIWNAPSPYSGESSYEMLNQFQELRKTFNGDLGQLLSFKASGGLAASFDGLCHPDRSQSLSFSHIEPPVYSSEGLSESTIVVAHEIGHLLGSRHTHACVWNGNNTAIDGCAGYVEGACGVPPTPKNGGTVMSYCHLQNQGSQINNGYGHQPGNVIRYELFNRPCTNQTNDIDNSTCEDEKLIIKLLPDRYGIETTWAFKDSLGNSLVVGGPYENAAHQQPFIDTICVSEGCYTFSIFDSYGDGICCKYGEGYFQIETEDGEVLAQGGSFGNQSSQQICISNSEDLEEDQEEKVIPCIDLLLEEEAITILSGNESYAYNLHNQNKLLRLNRNVSLGHDIDHEINEASLLVFEFGATRRGKLHSIGIRMAGETEEEYTFDLYGAEMKYPDDYVTYQSKGRWQTMTIPIGSYAQGKLDQLIFNSQRESSYFRNIRIIQADGCPLNQKANRIAPGDAQLEMVPDMIIYPNPAKNVLRVDVGNLLLEEEAGLSVELYTSSGVLMQRQNMSQGSSLLEMDVTQLPKGVYSIKVFNEAYAQVEKVLIF